MKINHQSSTPPSRKCPGLPLPTPMSAGTIAKSRASRMTVHGTCANKDMTGIASSKPEYNTSPTCAAYMSTVRPTVVPDANTSSTRRTQHRQSFDSHVTANRPPVAPMSRTILPPSISRYLGAIGARSGAASVPSPASAPPPHSPPSTSPTPWNRQAGRKRPFMNRTARTGCWEGKSRVYFDTHEDAEGDGIPMDSSSVSDSELDSESSQGCHTFGATPSMLRERTQDMGKHSTLFGKKQQARTGHPSLNLTKVKMIHSSKGPDSSTATNHIVPNSNRDRERLFEKANKGKQRLVDEKRRNVDEGPNSIILKTEASGYEHSRASVTRTNRQYNVENHDEASVPATTPRKQYAMPPQSWMAPTKLSSPVISTTHPGSCAASTGGIRLATPGNLTTRTRWLTHLGRFSSRYTTSSNSPSTNTADESLSFGVIYRIDEHTSEVMIPVGHTINLALQHVRNGTIMLPKMQQPPSPLPSPPPPPSQHEELSMGTIYRVQPDTDEVMIPASYARNMLLVHHRSGALNLHRPSASHAACWPPKRRKTADHDVVAPTAHPVDSDRLSDARRRHLRRPRRKGSSSSGGAIDTNAKSRHTMSAVGTAAAAAPKGSSAARPVEIFDDTSDYAGSSG